MQTQTISTTVTTSVVLDAGHYGHVLTVAASGQVAPNAAGADGIAGPSTASNDRVTNFGIVLGGLGASAAFSAYAGGAGIYLAGGGGVSDHPLAPGGFSRRRRAVDRAVGIDARGGFAGMVSRPDVDGARSNHPRARWKNSS